MTEIPYNFLVKHINLLQKLVPYLRPHYTFYSQNRSPTASILTIFSACSI